MKKLLIFLINLILTISISAHHFHSYSHHDYRLDAMQTYIIDLEDMRGLNIPRYEKVKDYTEAFAKSDDEAYIVPIETFSGVCDALILKKISKDRGYGYSIENDLFLETRPNRFRLTIVKTERNSYKPLERDMEIKEKTQETWLLDGDYTFYVVGNYIKKDNSYIYPKNVLDFDRRDYLSDYLGNNDISVLNYVYTSQLRKKFGDDYKILDYELDIDEVYFNPNTYQPLFVRKMEKVKGYPKKESVTIYDYATGKVLRKEDID